MSDTPDPMITLSAILEAGDIVGRLARLMDLPSDVLTVVIAAMHAPEEAYRDVIGDRPKATSKFMYISSVLADILGGK